MPSRPTYSLRLMTGYERRRPHALFPVAPHPVAWISERMMRYHWEHANMGSTENVTQAAELVTQEDSHEA
jgi:hypothetical protein